MCDIFFATRNFSQRGLHSSATGKADMLDDLDPQT